MISFWALAEEFSQFYTFSSAWGDDRAENERLLRERRGVIVFAGAVLSDPDLFDYIDINPRSARSTRRAIDLHNTTGKPLVITGDNDYPADAHRDRFLAWDDAKKMTIQHIPSAEELKAAVGVDDKIWNDAMMTACVIADRCTSEPLAKAPRIHFDGDFPALVAAGKAYRIERGHIKKWTEEYQLRMEREMALVHEKDFESYFMVVADLVVWAKERMLVGPGRGSSAGSLLCYLLRITEVDSIVHNLLFERFIDAHRADLPDIDIDFNDQKRQLVFDYLKERYGAENMARLGSINRLKPRSVIAHVGKKMAIPHGSAFGVANMIVDHSSGSSLYGKGIAHVFETTEPGKDFLERFPEAKMMVELELHASRSGVHAAAAILSNAPVTSFCTVRDGVAHLNKKDSEYLELLKIDILGLRTLGVIEDAGVISAEELYGLPLTDKKAFQIFNDRKFCGLFQFEGAAQRSVAIMIDVKSFKQIDHITALARPGPLGGGASTSYTARCAGREEVTYRHPSMEAYLSDTLGVVLYQEQVMKIVREIGHFSWEDTSAIRKAMSAIKGTEYFDRMGAQFREGAARLGIPGDGATVIWDEIVSFGAWGMNRSHTVSYAVISFWCAWIKCHYPTEFAAACLRNAKDEIQTIEMLRELTAEGIAFVPFDPHKSKVNWSVSDAGELVGGYSALKGIGPVKAQFWVNKRDAGGGLTDADIKKIARHVPQVSDLSPAHTMWKEIYEDPDSQNVNGRIREFGELSDNPANDQKSVVIIGQLIELKRRDQNESRLVNKRGGKVYKGQTLFVDLFLVDDSVSQKVRCRVPSKLWNSYGRLIADTAKPKVDWFLVRGRWLYRFNMMSVERIKCLTNKEMFLG